MEKIVGQIFGVVGTGMMVIFCIFMLQGALPMAGTLVAYVKEDAIEPQNESRMERILSHKISVPIYTGRVMEPGRWIFWEDCLSVETTAEEGGRVETSKESSLYLLDVLDENGASKLTESYRAESGELMFSKGGIYTLRFQVHGVYGRSLNQEVRIPVEGA